MAKVFVQIIGMLVLVCAVTTTTLYMKHRNADGPSILFPGGKLVGGELHKGPEPDWSFTDDIAVIELETSTSGTSRRVFIMESEGKIYVPSGYMKSFLGNLWKEWAFRAVEGDDHAVARIQGVRYERRLVRIKEDPALDGVAAKLAAKYGSTDTLASIESGDTWIFELAPREPLEARP